MGRIKEITKKTMIGFAQKSILTRQLIPYAFFYCCHIFCTEHDNY